MANNRDEFSLKTKMHDNKQQNGSLQRDTESICISYLFIKTDIG